MADGARLLPIFGGTLFLIPLLWQGGPEAQAVEPGDTGRTAWVMTYIFLVWLGLVVLSGILARHLTADGDAPEDDGET